MVAAVWLLLVPQINNCMKTRGRERVYLKRKRKGVSEDERTKG